MAGPCLPPAPSSPPEASKFSCAFLVVSADSTWGPAGTGEEPLAVRTEGRAGFLCEVCSPRPGTEYFKATLSKCCVVVSGLGPKRLSRC